jgi:hypothetical protein
MATPDREVAFQKEKKEQAVEMRDCEADWV